MTIAVTIDQRWVCDEVAGSCGRVGDHVKWTTGPASLLTCVSGVSSPRTGKSFSESSQKTHCTAMHRPESLSRKLFFYIIAFEPT